MLVKPRPPHRAHAVAGLQQRSHPRTGPAAHQSKVTSMAARQEFDDGAGFAMPPHPEHDAFVSPFHGSECTGFRRCAQPPNRLSFPDVCNCTSGDAPLWRRPGISRFPDVQLHVYGCAALAQTRNARAKNVYALNQPRASPVKEKYSPAAVRAHETISMPLSSCRPLSPTICTSEMTDSTNEATSAQRGQFLRRWAASQTK